MIENDLSTNELHAHRKHTHRPHSIIRSMPTVEYKNVERNSNQVNGSSFASFAMSPPLPPPPPTPSTCISSEKRPHRHEFSYIYFRFSVESFDGSTFKLHKSIFSGVSDSEFGVSSSSSSNVECLYAYGCRSRIQKRLIGFGSRYRGLCRMPPYLRVRA